MKAQSLIHEYKCGVKCCYLDKSLSSPPTCQASEVLIDIKALLEFFRALELSLVVSKLFFIIKHIKLAKTTCLSTIILEACYLLKLGLNVEDET